MTDNMTMVERVEDVIEREFGYIFLCFYLGSGMDRDDAGEAKNKDIKFVAKAAIEAMMTERDTEGLEAALIAWLDLLPNEKVTGHPLLVRMHAAIDAYLSTLNKEE